MFFLSYLPVQILST